MSSVSLPLRRVALRAAGAAVLAAAVLVSAVSVLPATGSARAASSYNATDSAFASMMLAHHEDGVKLGQIAVKKGANSQVRRLGQGIVATQSAEAKTLAGMVGRFDTSKSTTPEIMARGAIDMARLKAAVAGEFDRTWLDVISAHHMGAIQMAQIEVRGGKNSGARSLAKRIVAKQRSELAQFNTLTRKLGG